MTELYIQSLHLDAAGQMFWSSGTGILPCRPWMFDACIPHNRSLQTLFVSDSWTQDTETFHNHLATL